MSGNARLHRLVLISCLSLAPVVVAVPDAQPQGSGTPRRVRIRFTSMPEGARFEFTFEKQNVRGNTPSTKVFTLVPLREVTVTFRRRQYEDCQKKFVVRWSPDGREGVVLVDGEEQSFSFAAAAMPPIVTCEMKRAGS